MSVALTFSLIPSDIAQFAPRLGTISLQRRDGNAILDLKTPGIITGCSRGVVPHLSRDHIRLTKAIRWVNVPFESFLERIPPVPTLQGGSEPLHTFLGFLPGQHIVSLSPRDPFDSRDMPPNGKDHISATCIRGVRKLSPAAWKSYVLACKPDVVVALSDTPFTQAPQSQKRLTKSIERSTAWLAHLLQSDSAAKDSVHGVKTQSQPNGLNILVNLVGGTDARARTTFSQSLVETLHGKEQEQIAPLRKLDEAVAGYLFELLPLRTTLHAEQAEKARIPSTAIQDLEASHDRDQTNLIIQLLQASLTPLPSHKARIVYATTSPHEILRLIRDVGMDLFDTHWAQRAADIGIALDFRFPVGLPPSGSKVSGPRIRDSGKHDLGHNLFDTVYANQHTRLSSVYLDASSHQNLTDSTQSHTSPVCSCAACSPVSPSTHIYHSTVEAPDSNITQPVPTIQSPYTRSYLHHLLHTHEMSSHSLLAMHNISVMDAFFSGIRSAIAQGDFSNEVDQFIATYDEGMAVFAEAETDWKKVELERGKGRIAREKEKQAQCNAEL